MRIVSLLSVVLSVSVAWAQEGNKDSSAQKQPTIPTTLAEAHAELERILSPEELAEIDALPSEDDMIRYHRGLGAGIRYNWGLWRDSPLARHMEEMGFAHPDTMSGVILATFWCKRHGQDLRLEERAVEYRKDWDAVWKAQTAKENHIRLQKARVAIRNMVMMAFLSVVLFTGGLACWILTKTPFYKQRIPSFFGPALLSKGYASLDKIAYVLMGAGGLLILVLWSIVRTTC